MSLLWRDTNRNEQIMAAVSRLRFFSVSKSFFLRLIDIRLLWDSRVFLQRFNTRKKRRSCALIHTDERVTSLFLIEKHMFIIIDVAAATRPVVASLKLWTSFRSPTHSDQSISQENSSLNTCRRHNNDSHAWVSVSVRSTREGEDREYFHRSSARLTILFGQLSAFRFVGSISQH